MYPGYPEFEGENFWNLTPTIVFKALHTYRRNQIKTLNNFGVFASGIGMSIAAFGGCKNPKESWYNPYSSALLKIEHEGIIDPQAAKVFIELLNQGSIPSWVLNKVDLDLLRTIAS